MGRHQRDESNESNEPDGFPVGNTDDSKRGRHTTGKRAEGKHAKNGNNNKK